MKQLRTLAALLFVGATAMAQVSGPPSGDNEKASVSQWIGPVEVTVHYSSPDVHASNGEDRKGHIWGELVHIGFGDQGYGVKSAPWRAGANENTTISVSHDVKIGGKELKAGTYALFLAYEKAGPSTWVFSKAYKSWGSYSYNPAEDALRVPVTPTDAPYTEWLTFGFDNRLPASTTAFLQWENKRFSFQIDVPNVNDIYVSIIRDELRGDKGFDTNSYLAAARFCAEHKVNLTEAVAWADMSMSPDLGGKEDFSSLRVKAQVLTAAGKDTEAAAVMDKAIRLPGTSMAEIHQYGRSLLAAGKNEKALEVFLYNQKTYPNDKFTTKVGLARAYTATGDKKNAIKNWELALKNVPEDQKQYQKTFEEALVKLKK